jgi:hypothetical protein
VQQYEWRPLQASDLVPIPTEHPKTAPELLEQRKPSLDAQDNVVQDVFLNWPRPKSYPGGG